MSDTFNNLSPFHFIHLEIWKFGNMPGKKPPHEKIMLNIKNSTTNSEECCLWTGYMNKVNPYFSGINIKKYIWSLAHPNEEKIGYHFLENTCPNPNCINLDHLKIKDRTVDWDQVWERLLNRSEIVGECRLWTGSVDKKGYGSTDVAEKTYQVHRLSYMIHKNGGEEIPSHIGEDIAVIRHICPIKHNTSCFNPDHLILGTPKDNANDREINGTNIKGEKHYNSKITEAVAQKIKLSLFKKGEEGYKTQKARADFFQVSLRTVINIDCGNSWAHLRDRAGKDSSTQRDRNNKLSRENSKRKRETKITSEEFENAAKVLYSRIVKTSDKKKGEVEGDCWEYSFGKPNDKGYRYFSSSGRSKLAHIWSRSIHEKKELLPEEKTRHLCGNPPCINPSHLKFGTDSENSIDAILHGSKAAKLNVDSVKEIRSSELSKKELAQKYEVGRYTISDVISRRTWNFVV